MRRAHTVKQVRAAEEVLLARTAEGALMARASAGLATAIIELLGSAYGRRVLLLVGAGNNGGDALHAGALLARRGVQVEAVLLSPERTHEGGLAALRQAGGRVVDPSSWARPEVVVDGIVGLGGSGPLREDAAALVERVQGAPVVAVDVPSGVGVDDGTLEGPHVRAAVTVTFGTHKVAHLVNPAARACGAVHLVDIGLDLPEAELEALQAADVADLVPVPDGDAHKYTRGVVGVRAGSALYRGAAVLSVAGAGTGLAGMVRYVGGAADLVQAGHAEVVLGAGRVQAWVVGSGGGDGAGDELDAAIADGVPVVVDADGLGWVDGPLPVPAVLTPHAGELARLLGVSREEIDAAQLRHVREAARRFDCVVLLKGHHTLVARPDGRVRATTVGPSWLATAGAGDVLGGLIGGLLAAGLSPYDAASCGAWLHGAAAELAGDGGPLVAHQVATAVPAVVRSLLADHPRP